MSDTVIAAILSAWTLGFTAYLSYRQNVLSSRQRTATQEVNGLKDDVSRLSKQLEAEHQLRLTLVEYVVQLRVFLITKGFEPPKPPESVHSILKQEGL